MSSDKQNFFRRTSNKSGNNIETSTSSDLNATFAAHLANVRKLESENEGLKQENQKLVISCNQEIQDIKSTYGSEIDSLRRALDETTKEKCTTDYHNDKLLEENNNLKIKLSRKTESFNELESKYEEAETNIIRLRKSAEQQNDIFRKNEELERSITLMREQLKNECAKRFEAESRATTLNDEVTFLKKVNTNKAVSREQTSSTNTRNEAYYTEKFDKEMRSLQEDLTKEFEQYKIEMEEVFNKKINELTATNTKVNEKCHRIFSEKKVQQVENDELRKKVTALEQNIASLIARNDRHNDTIAKLNRDHDNFIKDILEENSELKEKNQAMSDRITAMLSERIATDKEMQMFRSMLKGEQSRANLTDTNSPKRRKLVEDNDESEVSAWSKNGVKMICESNTIGNYILILNDSPKSVDLNEWSLNIETTCGSSEALYTFAPRIIEIGSSLKVWSADDAITNDEFNLLMNVNFPSANAIKACRLHNDMDEIEASFEIKMPIKRRKILKANVSKKTGDQECSIM